MLQSLQLGHRQRSAAMSKGILHEYTKMSTEDQRTFDRWIIANIVLGVVFAAVITVMAVVGSNSLDKSDAAIAANSKTGTALQHPVRYASQTLSPATAPACCHCGRTYDRLARAVS